MVASGSEMFEPRAGFLLILGRFGGPGSVSGEPWSTRQSFYIYSVNIMESALQEWKNVARRCLFPGQRITALLLPSGAEPSGECCP